MYRADTPQGKLKQLADDLFWCLGERYVARDEMVLKNGNEMVNFYVGLNEADATKVAASIEAVLGPVRRRRVGELLRQMEDVMAELRVEAD